MIRALVRAGRVRVRDFDYHFYEGEAHGWRQADTIVDSIERIESFLNRYVLDRAD